MINPPWLATQLLCRVLAAGERDAVLGDLLEEFALRASVSSRQAARWYWSQALRSLPILLGHRARRDRWVSTAAVALAAYVIVGLLNAVGTSLVQPWLNGRGQIRYVVTAIVGLTAIAVGAHLASRVRPAAGLVLGALVMMVSLLFLVSPVDASPAWYQLTFLFLGPWAARRGAVGERG